MPELVITSPFVTEAVPAADASPPEGA